ncbi:hypothetical protein C8R45DRAFT_1010120 [Mycena sanguinolenta]|nr:hypothetical protein C8R45DRAFT_1010120 [Mycena sanguinolenta]
MISTWLFLYPSFLCTSLQVLGLCLPARPAALMPSPALRGGKKAAWLGSGDACVPPRFPAVVFAPACRDIRLHARIEALVASEESCVGREGHAFPLSLSLHPRSEAKN